VKCAGNARITGLALLCRYALGFRSCGRTVIDFASESMVIYPVAHHLVLYNLETRAMDFFHHVRHTKYIQSFQLSPNRELLAIAEVFQQSAVSSGQLSANGAGSTSAASPLPLPVVY
jgi:hypothetical protein